MHFFGMLHSIKKPSDYNNKQHRPVRGNPVSKIQEHAGLEWTQRKELGSLFLLRFLVWVSLFFGRNFTKLMLYPISVYFIVVAKQARQASRQYLQKVLGRPIRWPDIFKHFFYFATVSLDRIYFLNGQTHRFVCTIENENLLHQAMRQDQGLFLFGAHMGSFEAIRALGRQHTDYSLALLMYQDNAQKIGQVMATINPNLQQEIIPLGDVSSMMRVHDALKHGTIIGILADRALKQAHLKKQRFLGDYAAFSENAFRLAATLRKPVLLMMGLHLGGNSYKIVFEEVYDFSMEQKNSIMALEAAQKQYISLLEKYCRQYPYNWFNFYDFWRAPC